MPWVFCKYLPSKEERCFLEWAGVEDFEFPRLRSVSVRKDKPRVLVCTRTGGIWNREEWEDDIEFCRDHPNFVRDRDEDFDCTYMNFEYRVGQDALPEWEAYVRNQLTAKHAVLDVASLFEEPE